MKVLALIAFFYSSFIFAHGHHHHDHDHAHHSGEDLSRVYKDMIHHLNPKNIVNDKEFNGSGVIKFESGGDKFVLPESVLSSLVLSSLERYEDVVEKECSCDVSEFKQENRKRLPKIISKVKGGLKTFGETINGMLWSEVAGAKRYGIIYVVVSIVGEVIDHNISPVPLCKFVAFIARAISDKIKTATSLLSPMNNSIAYGARLKAFVSRLHYKRNYKKVWEQALKDEFYTEIDVSHLKFKEKVKKYVSRFGLREQTKKKFPEKFSSQVATGGLIPEFKKQLLELDPMSKFWYSDRLLGYFDFTYQLIIEQSRQLKKLKTVDSANFAKLQWNIGKYGDQIDKLKIHLYAASISTDKVQMLRAEKELLILVDEYRQFEKLLGKVSKEWKADSVFDFSNKMKTFSSTPQSLCHRGLGHLLSWKTFGLAAGSLGAYLILSEDH